MNMDFYFEILIFIYIYVYIISLMHNTLFTFKSLIKSNDRNLTFIRMIVSYEL